MAGVYIAPAIAEIRRLYAALLDPGARAAPIRDHLAAQAACLSAAHASGDGAIVFQITCWHPAWIGQGASAILAGPFSPDDARLTIAREHGYSDWAAVEAGGARTLDMDFEAAVDAALAGDLVHLAALLRAAPDLVARRSRYAHQASLLHYLGANGVESWRQVTPRNADAVVGALIAAGADVNADAPIYGGSRVLALVLTSAHPRDAGLDGAMAGVLRAAGAH